MKLTTGFRLSKEQLEYLKEEYNSLCDKMKESEVKGMFRLAARQEALLVLYDLHKLEVKRIKELGDNVALADFVQSKEI
ncbi:MAG: hypothetical protein ABFD50_16515 [Smithella sp.]